MPQSLDDIILFLIIVTCLILGLVAFIATILLLYRKRQVFYNKEIEAIKVDYEKNLLKTQLEIQEQTFQAISREIHDNISLSLTLAKLTLNTLDLSNHREQLAKQIGVSIECISNAITDLSDISRSMNSEVIAEQGLICALQQEIERLQKLEWFVMKFEMTGEPVYIDAQKELFIFRIAQEAFNNILKHARAKNIHLRLHYNENNVHITISDNGIGFVKDKLHEKRNGLVSSGLRNMQKRAELLNGKFCIETLPGEGTMIKLVIPF